MKGLLRFVRGFFGVVAAYQVLGLLPALTWLGQIDLVEPGHWVILGTKFIVLVIATACFVGLRTIVNKNADPPILKTFWSL